MTGPVWIAMRARNDMPLVERTLAGIAAQKMPHRLLVLDNGSKDGTREAALRVADRVIDIPEGAYIPGRVLNLAMAETEGELVVFLNSDCEPLDPDWLGKLVAAMGDPDVAAAFGRQDPRPDCAPLMAKDTVMTFGDGKRQATWLHCFSMASSCLRRSVWEAMPFSETLRYSEDIDWTWRARKAGWSIGYAPDSAVLHSHNYSLNQLRKRQYGEGYAEAEIFKLPAGRRGFLRYSVLPWGRLVLSDAAWCLARGRVGAALASPATRWVMAAGRRAGFEEASRTVASRHRDEAIERARLAVGQSLAAGGSATFNTRLASALAGIAVQLDSSSGGALAGLVLCGGYGRGEGSVVRSPEGKEFAWNDVDLLPVAKPGRVAALKEALSTSQALEEAFRAEFRADLDLGRPIDEEGIRALPPVLLWLETARGHRVIGGEPELFARNIGFDPATRPGAIEAEKLLLNRGSGLLMALAKAAARPVNSYDCSDPDFTRRNAAKCQLALGDALLMAAGCYETAVAAKEAAFRGAERAIRKLLGDEADRYPEMAAAYAAGIAFKRDPGIMGSDPSNLSSLAGLWLLVFATVESARSGRPWPGAEAFNQTNYILERVEHRGPRALARNLLHNARRGSLSLRYPRELLFREATVLLEMAARGKLPEGARMEDFIGLWKRYN
ncbi:MAG: glycosyltransferase [Spirochaetota bacterium]